jgi:hypothetical protein
MLDEWEKRKVECAERFADGLVTDDEFLECQSGVGLFFDFAVDEDQIPNNVWALYNAVSYPAFDSVTHADAPARISGRSDECVVQCQLGRDIFGNPFRPASADQSVLTSNVIEFAQAMYQERGFDRMAVLADAMEEAGCTDAAILDHCRRPGEHVRGCWVVDLLLGKK